MIVEAEIRILYFFVSVNNIPLLVKMLSFIFFSLRVLYSPVFFFIHAFIS